MTRKDKFILALALAPLALYVGLVALMKALPNLQEVKRGYKSAC